MNVEDIASKISVFFRYTAWLKRPNFWVHVSPDSAETLAREGGITNHHLIVYSLSNICATNYQNRFMCVEVIVCYIIVVFLRHSVYSQKSIPIWHVDHKKFSFFLDQCVYTQWSKKKLFWLHCFLSVLLWTADMLPIHITDHLTIHSGVSSHGYWL